VSTPRIDRQPPDLERASVACVANPANYFRRFGASGREVTFTTHRALLGVLLPESAGREARDTSVCARQLDEILRQKDKAEPSRSLYLVANQREISSSSVPWRATSF